MTLRFEALSGTQSAPIIDGLAALRIRVFRDWPYLYDGGLDYERGYLHAYRDNPRAIIVTAFDDAELVGASTGLPLQDADAEFAQAFQNTEHDPTEIFYCAESVLLPQYRGQGAGHRFFDLREGHARALGYRKTAFCSVIRPADHPARPDDYRPLDALWHARGYAPLDSVIAQFSWRDLGAQADSLKPLQFWMRDI